MNVGKAVYGILSANSGVTDIVGTNIFPEIAEQETAVPFIVYQLQNVSPEDTHDGPSKLDEVQFEFLCYADSYNAAADLGVAVRAALDRVSGTYNGVNVESVQFNDVDIEIEYDPRRYSQVLKFTFRIKRDDVTIALGTPVTGAVLGDLSDVDVTGVTNGQLIAYNSTTQNWEAADDAGGANELNDLSDANISLPSDGEVLIYSGGEFVNDNIAISNVTGLQAALDAAPDNLRELTDVTISGLADNDYLQYNSATGVWENSALILGRNGEQYTGNYDSEAETLLDGATETVELYYTAQADGDGLHEDAQTDTAQSGYDIRRKLYYAEKAQADPNTSGDWTQFADIADDTTYASAKATLLAYLKQRTGGTVPISLKMTWEEVAEATLLLDTYTGAAAAYSLRQLRTGETEAVRVRRSSDNTEQTIGFSGGELDTTALATFCGSSDGFVKTWMDQSGNGNDATQTTAANQPKIYDGTSGVVTENGKPALYFETSFISAPTISMSAATCFVHHTNFDATFRMAAAFDRNDNSFFYDIVTGYRLRNGGNIQITGLSSTTSKLVYALIDGAGSELGINGATATTGTLSVLGGHMDLDIGKRLSSYWKGTFSEVVVYDSDQSSNRTNIESNINTFYSIF